MMSETDLLHQGNRFDHSLVQHDEVCAVLLVDDDIRQADKEPLIFIDDVRHAIPHRRNHKVTDIGAVDCSDLNAGFFALGHFDLRFPAALRLSFPSQKLLPSTQLLMFVFPHFLAPFL